MIQRTISRTRENAYDKIDQARYVRRPSFEEVPATSFLAVKDLIIARPNQEYQMKSLDQIDIDAILDRIEKENYQKRIHA